MIRHRATLRFLGFGALFGLCFPLIAWALEILELGLPFSAGSVVRVHSGAPLVWIIDSAPFWLGLFASLAGRRQDRLEELNRQLEARVRAGTGGSRDRGDRLRGPRDSIRGCRHWTGDRRRGTRRPFQSLLPSRRVVPSTQGRNRTRPGHRPRARHDDGGRNRGRQRSWGARGEAEPFRTDSADEATDLRGLRILIAEDNLINQTVTRKMLSVLGCVSDVVPSGDRAIRAVADGDYDLVLMDCHMPGVDGFEATCRIRELEANGERIPIVALSASAMGEDRRRCFKAGMDDFLAKPTPIEDLRAAIKRWAGRGSTL